MTTLLTSNNLDRIWAQMASADRIVLLGHERDTLTADERIRLATIARGSRTRPTRRSR